jgi:hypothetical protein
VIELPGDPGYPALRARRGGLALLHRRSHRVVITDVGLAPGGRRGARCAPVFKVLFISGYAENAVPGFLEPGMEMMTKPSAVEVLAARIRATGPTAILHRPLTPGR